MNFFNDEIHQDMVDMYRDFAQNSCAPIAAELDEQERFPEENIPVMAEMGLLGIPFPEEYGGAGLDEVSYAQCVEEVSKVCASTGVTISAHTSLGTWPIYKFGTEEQKKKYLPDLCSGKKLGAFGLTEPDAGTDAAGQKTTFEDKGDYYLVNGSKIFITNAGYADVFIVFGMTDKSQGTKGISCLILEKGMEGFTIGKHEHKMGIRGSSTCELVFDNVKVPKENLLGEVGKGFKIATAAVSVSLLRLLVLLKALSRSQSSTSKRELSSADLSLSSRTLSSSWLRCRLILMLQDFWSIRQLTLLTKASLTPSWLQRLSWLLQAMQVMLHVAAYSCTAAMATPVTIPSSA